MNRSEPTDEELQAELDAAQADLEDKVGALKHAVEDKLAAPKHAIEVVARPVSWIARHKAAAALIAIALGYVVHRLRVRARARAV